MSWLNPYGISLHLIIGRLMESYPHMDKAEIWRRALAEQQQRIDNIVWQVQAETEWSNNLSPNNTEIIDEPDEENRFFISHPQEAPKLPAKFRIPFTKAQREEIIMTLGKHCATCNKIEDLQIHHIDGNPANNALENLELLCYRCHKKTHAPKQEKDKI
jgi:5-methylcytosine-specific restriction endonuclease McrA